ncbi:hypothetical protein VNO80_26788 [Phaseolus coccineus]|uniref:Uncharacterized protein n=1 Tax=Phaseolus coccineus TaxID=3886 RepID=A0AAN9LKG6_PHACN
MSVTKRNIKEVMKSGRELEPVKTKLLRSCISPKSDTSPNSMSEGSSSLSHKIKQSRYDHFASQAHQD